MLIKPDEIYANMVVRKFNRNNPVLVPVSDKRFRIFIFKPRKKLRETNNSTSEQNNFDIIISLKHVRKPSILCKTIAHLKLFICLMEKYMRKSEDKTSTTMQIHVKNPAMIRDVKQIVRDAHND